ncbi:MAG: thioredoxin domain-containing protein [Chloracidobacterium sp.]|nr:thioredoxin domain-containing protein [Chloracidobacterium sp.]
MRNDIKILIMLAVIVVVGAVIGTYFYRESVQSERKPTNTAATAAPKGQLIRSDSPSIGPENAKITLVEFLDPECESCAGFSPVVKKIMADYDGQIRLVVRYMPLHPNSFKAATFTEVAGEEGKYWEAQKLLFEKQGEWGTPHGPPSSAPKPDIDALFKSYAKTLGIDAEKYTAAVAEKRFAEKLERDRKDGQGLGVRRTPTFFVNGRELARFGEEPLRALIDEEMKK